MDYSISLNGFFSACRSIERAASHLVKPDPATDIASELIEARRATLAGKANLRVISAESELQESLLDLFA